MSLWASLLLCTLFACALPACKRGQSFHAPDWSLDRMIDQPRVDPWESPMRKAPEGTIPTGKTAWDPGLETGRVYGLALDRVPLPKTRALLERGRTRFEISCAVCHGLLGDGNSVAATHMTEKKPSSLLEPKVREKKPGEIFAVITAGHGYMPALGAEIARDDRWAIVAYLRALQRSQRADVASLPPDARQALAEAP